ncbi:hypothetical protein MPTK1_5g04460 [Marchantia polymorpha subsp. ruderalis]|uniref:Uncharacterized protein n=2 Tax=Marchantia polymorpha TaxID=3197 RepID=A0AAF6BEW8_MARPO|nr:hypothetical protein MARPO_0027s0180 [Marchantia polymorpha]BBN10552.1 hypothetical protein Mp_5g04460 [Marchantia polymorpha subsp. ruderalis]|eukprot:PTQ43083.1 hypothetical protein MARPO_0027s0180 [Marchantia polymorpha]
MHSRLNEIDERVVKICNTRGSPQQVQFRRHSKSFLFLALLSLQRNDPTSYRERNCGRHCIDKSSRAHGTTEGSSSHVVTCSRRRSLLLVVVNVFHGDLSEFPISAGNQMLQA